MHQKQLDYFVEEIIRRNNITKEELDECLKISNERFVIDQQEIKSRPKIPSNNKFHVFMRETREKLRNDHPELEGRGREDECLRLYKLQNEKIEKKNTCEAKTKQNKICGKKCADRYCGTHKNYIQALP